MEPKQVCQQIAKASNPIPKSPVVIETIKDLIYLIMMLKLTSQMDKNLTDNFGGISNKTQNIFGKIHQTIPKNAVYYKILVLIAHLLTSLPLKIKKLLFNESFKRMPSDSRNINNWINQLFNNINFKNWINTITVTEVNQKLQSTNIKNKTTRAIIKDIEILVKMLETIRKTYGNQNTANTVEYFKARLSRATQQHFNNGCSSCSLAPKIKLTLLSVTVKLKQLQPGLNFSTQQLVNYKINQARNSLNILNLLAKRQIEFLIAALRPLCPIRQIVTFYHLSNSDRITLDDQANAYEQRFVEPSNIWHKAMQGMNHRRIFLSGELGLHGEYGIKRNEDGQEQFSAKLDLGLVGGYEFNPISDYSLSLRGFFNLGLPFAPFGRGTDLSFQARLYANPLLERQSGWGLRRPFVGLSVSGDFNFTDQPTVFDPAYSQLRVGTNFLQPVYLHERGNWLINVQGEGRWRAFNGSSRQEYELRFGMAGQLKWLGVTLTGLIGYQNQIVGEPTSFSNSENIYYAGHGLYGTAMVNFVKGSLYISGSFNVPDRVMPAQGNISAFYRQSAAPFDWQVGLQYQAAPNPFGTAHLLMSSVSFLDIFRRNYVNGLGLDVNLTLGLSVLDSRPGFVGMIGARLTFSRGNLPPLPGLDPYINVFSQINYLAIPKLESQAQAVLASNHLPGRPGMYWANALLYALKANLLEVDYSLNIVRFKNALTRVRSLNDKNLETAIENIERQRNGLREHGYNPKTSGIVGLGSVAPVCGERGFIIGDPSQPPAGKDESQIAAYRRGFNHLSNRKLEALATIRSRRWLYYRGLRVESPHTGSKLVLGIISSVRAMQSIIDKPEILNQILPLFIPGRILRGQALKQNFLIYLKHELSSGTIGHAVMAVIRWRMLQGISGLDVVHILKIRSLVSLTPRGVEIFRGLSLIISIPAIRVKDWLQTFDKMNSRGHNKLNP